MKRREFIILLSGSTAAWPLAARAQQSASSPRIGFLPLGSPSNGSDMSLVEAFQKGGGDTGLLEGHDVILDVVWNKMEVSIRKN
jgi:putative tryptophan/tyrosine transport system substrate-binding protein